MLNMQYKYNNFGNVSALILIKFCVHIASGVFHVLQQCSRCVL